MPRVPSNDGIYSHALTSYTTDRFESVEKWGETEVKKSGELKSEEREERKTDILDPIQALYKVP